MTTSLTNSQVSFIFQEIQEVLDPDSLKNINDQTIIRKTSSGRVYHVSYVVEDVWENTKRRVKGYYHCDYCPQKELPGGNWIQIIANKGSPNEAVVRFHDSLIHLLTNHSAEPEARIYLEEKTIRVFGPATV